MTRAEGRRAMADAKKDKSTKDKRKVGFYNLQAGIRGRDGGPYLDEVETLAAEVVRARKEDREPITDLNDQDLAAPVGVMLVPAHYLVDNAEYSNPSMATRPGLGSLLTDEAIGDNDDFVNPKLLTVDFGTEPVKDSGDPTRVVSEEKNGTVVSTENPNESGEGRTEPLPKP